MSELKNVDKVFPVTQNFVRQMNKLREQTVSSQHALYVMQNSRYSDLFSSLIGVSENEKLFKDFYNKKVNFEVVKGDLT